MLKNLKIKNFRSIIDADISFGGLTVLIGANGSGKSNILTAIKFLSTFVSAGIEQAVPNAVRFNSIIPKTISDGEVNDTVPRFDYIIEHPQGADSPKRFNHVFEIKRTRHEKRICDIGFESIAFMNPFGGKGFPANIESRVTVTKNASVTSPKIEIVPEVNRDNFDAVLRWFGLSNLTNLIDLTTGATSPRDFSSVAELVFTDPQPEANKSLVGRQTLLALIGDLNFFRYQLAEIRAYNFVSHDLRSSYPLSNVEFGSSGRNMPSAFKRMKDESVAHVARVLSTLSDIAPHIDNMDVTVDVQDRAFIEFTENFLKRKVAAFDSSDGTLRALALMLALELQPAGTTILIEEPEQNLHPWAVKPIIDFAREVSEERNVQVVFTTHSEHVLKCVKPEEVRIITRKQEEGTKVRTIKDVAPNSTIEMGEVGDSWVRGLIGGTPLY